MKGERRVGTGFRSASSALGGGDFWIYGNHSVCAALLNPRRFVHRLIVSHNRHTLLMRDALLREYVQSGSSIKVEKGNSGVFSRLLGEDCVHQGIAAYVSPLPALTIDDIPAGSIVVALDCVVDPRNVGSIMRSCAAYGCGGLIVCRRRGAPLSALMMKAASGGFEYVRYISVGNFARGLRDLSLRNFYIVGLSGGADFCLGAERDALRARDGGIVIVLGSEGGGLRRNTVAHCDMTVRLPVSDNFSSLNVSAAAAVALHIVSGG